MRELVSYVFVSASLIAAGWATGAVLTRGTKKEKQCYFIGFSTAFSMLAYLYILVN